MKNFKINKERGAISKEFSGKNISDFHAACEYISKLPYKRNTDKKDIRCIFNDAGGTCSTKHAVLRKLALENNHADIKLIVGIFKMDVEYTLKIKKTLEKFNLTYIPEAHSYLKIDEEYFDFTRPNSDYAQFKSKILTEKEIEYDGITDTKIAFHKDFLQNWIAEDHIPYTLDEMGHQRTVYCRFAAGR